MKQFFNYALIALLFCFCCNKSIAQQIHAEARLEKASIPIGDQTSLKLSITFPAKDSVSFPVLKDTIGKLQIVKIGKADTSFANNDLNTETISKNITVTSFDAGAYLIPAYDFKTKSGVFKTEPVQLQVTDVKVDTTKAIYDIKQPILVKYTWVDWLKDNGTVVSVTAIIVLAIIGLIVYLKTRPKKVVAAPVEVKVIIPAHQLALTALNTLRDKKLWQQGQVKEYYIELSDIIREYLEKKYLIKASEQTTDEIFAAIKYMEISQVNRNILRQLLILSDLVKFAKEKPLPAENELSMDNAVAFVTNTKTHDQASAIQGDIKGNEFI